MTNQEDFSKITPSPNYSAQIKQFEDNLLEFMKQYGLPTDSVLVTVSERFKVFKNIEDVVEKIEDSQKQRSFYISKLIAASAVGLFDAALNYLWDETIYELRIRVAQYDLDYFFDTAVGASSDRRKKLKDKDDLVKINDSELIKAANEIGLISDLGFQHLDYVRYMRNWASAAHPNHNQITGLQLNGNGVAWNAQGIYRTMLEKFDSEQALLAILSFNYSNISASLQHKLCQEKFRELLKIMTNKVSSQVIKEFIEQ